MKLKIQNQEIEQREEGKNLGKNVEGVNKICLILIMQEIQI